MVGLFFEPASPHEEKAGKKEAGFLPWMPILRHPRHVNYSAHANTIPHTFPLAMFEVLWQ